jgi:EAL domain-containing protein (putative c-di-GMP-specific phosphodiesterase class I)
VDFVSTDFSRAYSEQAAALLRDLDGVLCGVFEPLLEAYYANLEPGAPPAKIASRFTPEEFKRVKERYVQYLTRLFSSTLTQDEHRAMARRAGRAQALIGTDVQWPVEILLISQGAIVHHVARFDPVTREAILRVVSQRVLIDVHEEMSGYNEARGEVTAAFAELDRLVLSSATFSDLMHAALEAMTRLPGRVSGYFARADELGTMQIEATFGSADRYHEAMVTGLVPKLTVHPDTEIGQGPGGRAWRTGEIVICDAWHIDAERAPWHPIGRELDIRASALIPILDENGGSVAMLGIFSTYPGFFSTPQITGFCSHVRQILSHAFALRAGAPVVALTDRDEYRRMLNAERVALRYQPILNLHDGSLAKIEALARLRDDKGEIIPPSRFLPALGQLDLQRLFELVVHRAVRECAELERTGLRTRVAVNMPAHALGSAFYLNAIFSALEKYALPPERLAIEVLETAGGAPDAMHHRQFIAYLRDKGITIEQDDLGSGHSSLVRLDQFPFDAVKVDQELVSGALRSPQRALEFILYLTRLAHALDTPITVEGLERVDILEAAAVLGADWGQGFAIAKPMELEELRAWHAAYEYPVSVEAPRTKLGMRAAQLIGKVA